MTKHERAANAIVTDLLSRHPDHYRGSQKWTREQIVTIVLDTLTDNDPIEPELLRLYNSEEARLSLADEAAGEWLIESWANRY